MSQSINTTKDLLTALREGIYTSLGNYPTFFLTQRGDVLSHTAVRENLKQELRSLRDKTQSTDYIVAVDINWEDSDLYCDDTGERIPSADAEPENA